MTLGMEDYEWAAKQLNCEVNVIKAFVAVESAGSGFLENGQPKILFEAHHFSKMTGGKYDRSHPSISSHHWNRALYIGGEGEHRRLAKAVELDREAALKSASWGAFQIMGFNWKACGYESLQDFVNDMYAGEFGQLKAFVGFIKAMRLQDHLQDKRWKALARGYNGPGYQVHDYDGRLERAYKKLENTA
jgi:N-acetylmuramidase